MLCYQTQTDAEATGYRSHQLSLTNRDGANIRKQKNTELTPKVFASELISSTLCKRSWVCNLDSVRPHPRSHEKEIHARSPADSLSSHRRILHSRLHGHSPREAHESS